MRLQRKAGRILGGTLALGLAALIGGCARRALFSASADEVHLRMQPGDYQKVASVNGRNCTGRYFIFQFSTPDVFDAERSALAAAPSANLLLNKHVYREDETVVPVLFSRDCFYVEGVAVKLKQ